MYWNEFLQYGLPQQRWREQSLCQNKVVEGLFDKALA